MCARDLDLPARAGTLVVVSNERLDQALQHAEEMLQIVLGAELADREALAQQTVWDYDHHFTPGLVRYRKSVTEAGDFAAVEWTGEGSIVRDVMGREWID